MAARRPLKICILSRKRTLYTTRRLVEAAREIGHETLVVDPLACHLVVGHRFNTLYHRSGRKRLDDVDVVIPRIGASITEYGLAAVNQFDMMGIPLVNNSLPISRSRDKLRCLQLLSRHDIDIPRTVMARSPDQIERAIDLVGGCPVVLKLLQGTQGVGVLLAETPQQVESLLDTFWGLNQNILIQEFVRESAGRDVRALVVGGRVVAAMRRTAKLGEFRSNIHRGGEGTPVELDSEFARVAVEATAIVGLQIAGVDMLEARDGPKVIELNSSPGFEGLEQATGMDVASLMVRYAVDYARQKMRARRLLAAAQAPLRTRARRVR
jgi:ribosomal protein S6--L-glutamate ligase